jgi:hypothetical protein
MLAIPNKARVLIMFKAVTKEQLIALLGRQCSPEYREQTAYVIGPDLSGRICHIATCKGGIVEAQHHADELNKE